MRTVSVILLRNRDREDDSVALEKWRGGGVDLLAANRSSNHHIDLSILPSRNRPK